MIVICDQCNNSFNIEKEDLKDKMIDNIKVTYFECRECNHKYVTSCVDEYIMKEQRRYQKLIKDINKADKSQKCLRNMKLHSDRLKKKVLEKV